MNALAFELPAGLEAAAPQEAWGTPRDGVRLMVASRAQETITHATFSDLAGHPRARRSARRQRLGDAAGGARRASGRRILGPPARIHAGSGARSGLARRRGPQRRRRASVGRHRRRAADARRRCSGDDDTPVRIRAATDAGAVRAASATGPSRRICRPTANRSGTGTSVGAGRCRTTRTCTPPSPAAPRCRAPAGRSPRH